MTILALDVGVGTTDVMLVDTRRNLENCTKLVLPSAAQLHASAVSQATKNKSDLFMLGDTVGGGPFSRAVRNHLTSGLRVFMTEGAAYSIRNDLDEVRERGIEVVDAPPIDFEGESLWLQEIRLRSLVDFLAESGEAGAIDVVAVAVQDHGVSPKGASNRVTRIERFQQSLMKDRRLESLSYDSESIPEHFLRMRSAAARAEREMPGAKVFVMDTSLAAALGCLADPSLREGDRILAVNIGNGHTLATLVDSGQVLGMMEAHTRAFDPAKLGRFLEGFLNCRLSNEDVFQDGGHGLFRLEERLPAPDRIMVTGPNRALMEGSGLRFCYAAPGGDVMMTGPVGLSRAVPATWR